jgi:tetratricopeptide (TPR) repeat protein
MSSLPNKINEEVAKALPWENMLLRHPHAKTYGALERFLNLSHDSLRKASKGTRGLSSKAYHVLMQDLIRYFSTGIEFRQWLYSSRWPQELIDQDRDYYAALYASINQAIMLPALGLPPQHYVSRPAEEERIFEVLTGEFSEARGIYISGNGGVGKTTLIAGTLSHYLSELNRRYERIIWVDILDGDGFESCIHQIVSVLDLKPKSQRIGGVVDELSSCFGQHPAILVCNAEHEVPELRKLVGLVGVQGRILITSRTRLPRVQARNYRLVQLEISALDDAQGEKLLENLLERTIREDEKQAVARVLQQTDGLPLALVLVASLASSPHISMESLANRLESHALNTLAISGVPPLSETSVRISLEITIDYLREHHPQAVTAFVTLGVFTRPHSSIQIFRQVLPASLSEQDQDSMVSLLNFHHLITLDELDGVAVWQTHTLLHELAKEYLLDDPMLSERLRQRWTQATSESLAQLRENFQHNQPVARIFDVLKADLMEISAGLLHDGQIIAALNLLENASSLLMDAGHFVEYQSWLDHLNVQLQSLDMSAEPIKTVVANFMNLHNGTLHDSFYDWGRAREFWRAVNFSSVDDPEMRQFVLGQIVKARSLEVIFFSRQGMLDMAQMVLENSQREFRDLGVDEAQQPEWQEALIEWFIVRGDSQAAKQAAQRALALYQDGENLAKMIQIQKTIADILVMDKDYEAAEDALRQLLQVEISSLSIRAELYIDLAHVLLQTLKPEDALLQLDQAEDTLNSFPEGTSPDSFARLWSCRAWGSEQLGNMKLAVDQAQKSLGFWRQIPDSEANQHTMLEMISRAQEEI